MPCSLTKHNAPIKSRISDLRSSHLHSTRATVLIYSMFIMKHVNRTTSLSKVHGRSTQNLYTKVKVRGMRNLKPNPLSHCLTRIALKFMLGM